MGENEAMRTFKWWIIGIVLVCAFGFLIIQESFVTIRGEDDVRLLYASNLNQICLAMNNYHDVYGRLPPSATQSKDGKPLLSWRVLLLPFLEENSLCREFHLDESWDSPHNRPLLDKMPDVYAMMFEEKGMTHYQVVVGPGTPFEKDGLTWNDFPDGRANTILIVDAADGVPWTKPVDLQYDSTAPIGVIGSYHQKSIHFSRYTIGAHEVFNAAFADGSIHAFRKEKDPESLRGFLTRNGGEALEWSLIK